MSYEYVKQYYGVPAEYGRVVVVDGRPGIIIKDLGHYIGVNFDDSKPGEVSTCHPTWEVIYKDMGTPRRLTRSQQRYRDYLDVSECYDNFKHYLNSLGYKKAN